MLTASLRKLEVLFAVGVLLIVADVRRVKAEGEPGPLVQMRDAAEALAEVMPESAAELGRKPQLPPVAATANKSSTVEALRAAVRAAANTEIAREVAPASSGRVGANSPGLGRGNGNGNGNSDGPSDAATQARNAAVQAQQARLNRNNERVNPPPMKGMGKQN